MTIEEDKRPMRNTKVVAVEITMKAAVAFAKSHSLSNTLRTNSSAEELRGV